MPTIEVVDGSRIEIHTGRETRVPHVHVCREGRDVVVNLLTLRPYGEEPFRLSAKIWDYLRENQEALLERWDEYHGGER